MQATQKLLDIAIDRTKTLKKRERKTKNEKKSRNSNQYLFTSIFLVRINYVMLENLIHIVTFVLVFPCDRLLEIH